MDDFKHRYAVDQVFYTDEIAGRLENALAPPLLLLLEGINTDSGKTAKTADFEGIDRFKVDKTILFPEIVEWCVLCSVK